MNKNVKNKKGFFLGSVSDESFVIYTKVFCVIDWCTIVLFNLLNKNNVSRI